MGGRSTGGSARRVIVLASFGLLVVGAVGFLVTTAIEESIVSIEGSLTFGEGWGGGTFTPTGCQSGSLANFHGVDLSAADDPRRVRVMEDATGVGRVVLMQSGREPQVVTSQDCTGFRIAVGQTGTRVNHIYAYEGVAQLDCPQVRGTVTFVNCAD